MESKFELFLLFSALFGNSTRFYTLFPCFLSVTSHAPVHVFCTSTLVMTTAHATLPSCSNAAPHLPLENRKDLYIMVCEQFTN